MCLMDFTDTLWRSGISHLTCSTWLPVQWVGVKPPPVFTRIFICLRKTTWRAWPEDWSKDTDRPWSAMLKIASCHLIYYMPKPTREHGLVGWGHVVYRRCATMTSAATVVSTCKWKGERWLKRGCTSLWIALVESYVCGSRYIEFTAYLARKNIDYDRHPVWHGRHTVEKGLCPRIPFTTSSSKLTNRINLPQYDTDRRMWADAFCNAVGKVYTYTHCGGSCVWPDTRIIRVSLGGVGNKRLTQTTWLPSSWLGVMSLHTHGFS